jgi:N-acetylglucosamine malate deacetylase 1
MKVLVLAPHPDDESIGCGGTICLHASQGHRVTVAFLTSGELGLKHLARDDAWRIREREAELAAGVLNVSSLAFLRLPDWYLGEHVDDAAVSLRTVMEGETPDLVYAPHGGEWHPDHRAALHVLRDALAKTELSTPMIRTYEVWTPLAEHTHVEDVSAVMSRKMRAVRCYESQLRGFRYDRAVRGLNSYRGELAARTRYAEVFGDG